MRWLLLKDLQILRRSPLQATLLIVYPVLIALLVGFAISRSPGKPRVAFLNQVPQNTPFKIGNKSVDVVGARSTLCERIECVRVHSRKEAIGEVKSGDVLGALILPGDLVTKLQSLSGLNPEQPTVQVIVNQEDPVKERLVDDRITSLLSEANLKIAREVARISTRYLRLIQRGGSLNLLGQSFPVLGLANTERILRALEPAISDPAERLALAKVIRFAALANQNLDLASPLLSSVAQPIKVHKEVISGKTPPLDVFAVAVAATVTLMFVTVLLVAGSLALEREENAFARLTRGLVSRGALLAEKVGLGMLLALAVTMLMLAGLEIFLSLHWSRIGLWLIAILAGAAGFAAAGAALGAATREVRAASLLAFMVSLPIAFLSLVPSGSVSPALFDVIRVLTSLFPFKPALHAMERALDASGPSMVTALIHLAVLTVVYGVLARFALRRFTAV
jgi:ABC-type transport system involved in cytochrome c biogenesis permease component